MTTGMKIAVWVSLGMNVLAVVLMVTVIGVVEVAVDSFEDLAADVEPTPDPTATAVVRREGCEWNTDYTDLEMHAQYERSNLTTEDCMPPRMIHVLEYMGAVAAGNVSRGTSDCIADRFAEYGKTWSLQEPVFGLYGGGGFGHSQVGNSLDHIWQCRDK
ncbi:MAG: hypothetical protein OXC95_06460 [Dehalococcoidia bacterium]|nr:hypothetical protein [Dehalococcoidia bacterium]